MNLNYSVIGTHPEVETHIDSLPALMAAYVSEPKVTTGMVIVKSAEHFYGLTLESADNSVLTLIDQIRSADQELQFA